MKVCIDLSALDDNFSGIERFAYSITRSLIQIDLENKYILIFKNRVFDGLLNIIDDKRVKSVIIRWNGGKLLFNQIILKKTLNQIAADKYLFLAFPVPIFLNKPGIISTIHDMCFYDVPWTMTKRSELYYKISDYFAVRKSQKIITISNFSKERIMARYQLNPEDIWLIYCGIDNRFLDYEQRSNSIFRDKYHLPEQYILSLSTIEPRKNLALLVEAYDELLREGVKVPDLVLAGRSGWKNKHLLHNISDVAKCHIRFTGFVDDADLPDVYSGATLFVFPSLYEGFGIPPLEALSVGCPVLSSDAASLPEVLDGQVHYFHSANRESLKGKMIQILQTDYEQPARRYASRFTWDRSASTLIRFLRGFNHDVKRC